MQGYRLPSSNALTLRFLVTERITEGLAAKLGDLLGRADTSRTLAEAGVPTPAVLGLAIIRRRPMGHYFVELRFFPPGDSKLQADLGPVLAPFLALPPHPEPPADLLNPPDVRGATGTVIRPPPG